MKTVFHKNICRYVDSFISNGTKLCLIMEYCDKGDLASYLERIKKVKQQTGLMSHTTADGFSQDATSSMNMNQIFDLGENRLWRFFL